jgi:CTP synthase (UTP-ammonia lyase)
VSVTIALIGDRKPDHPSHRELDAVRGMLGEDVVAEWVATDSEAVRDLSGLDGIWLVPGSPYADDAAAYEAVRWARENDVPYLGTCGGLQYAVVEFFRNVLGVASASHAESNGTGEANVVHALACGLQGEERLVRPIAGTRFSRLVNGEPFVGMHYCSYGPGPEEVQRLVEAGMVVEAVADDAGAEVIELPTNRFFMLTLFQPHIGALAGKPLHPLLREFVRCARDGSATSHPSADRVGVAARPA